MANHQFSNWLLANSPAVVEELSWVELDTIQSARQARQLRRKAAAHASKKRLRELTRIPRLVTWTRQPVPLSVMFPSAVVWALPDQFQHLALYSLVSLICAVLAVSLWLKGARAGAIIVAAMSGMTGLDSRSYDLIRPYLIEGVYPPLAVLIDCIAYGLILVAAVGVWRSAQEGSDATPPMYVFLCFAAYCFLATVFWALTLYADGWQGLAAVFNERWDLPKIAGTMRMPESDGVRAMTYLVWAEYGISGVVAVLIAILGVGARATGRWVAMPLCLYAALGPYLAGGPYSAQVLFLLIIPIALMDWIIVRRRELPRDRALE